MGLLELPRDIFLLVVAHLSAEDLIILRSVSKEYHIVFTDSELNFNFLLQNYPRSREAQSLNIDGQDIDTATFFRRVARRYHQLSLGVPASIGKYATAQSFVLPAWSRSYPVSPWQRFLHFENKQAPFDYSDALWTYDDGLLIFPSAELGSFAVLELQSRTLAAIDIEANTRTTRRIRLRDGVIVVEWCEPEPYHQLNENETVYRHFATAYDIIWQDSTRWWKAVFRFVHQISRTMSYIDI